MKTIRVLALSALAAAFATATHAATFTFDTDPFAGATALQTAGRQVIGNELFIPEFDLATDDIVINGHAFNLSQNIRPFTGVAADIPAFGANFIVFRTLDFDDNAANGVSLNAAQAADRIAAQVTQQGAGFFVYHNSALNLNRLVFSTDLSSSTADLKVVARFQDQSGQAGIDALAEWGPQLSAAIPEPAAWSLMILGFGAIGGAARRSRRLQALPA
jgi:hypothetical protein